MTGPHPAPAADAPSITVIRTIPAPPAEVFAAWTDPALLRRWLAPGPCEVGEAEADPRPGGRYRIVAVEPDGTRHVTTGEYLEVVPGRRLVKTWVYEGDGRSAHRYPTLLTVDFHDTGAGATELVIRQDQLLTAEDRAGNREGWRLCLNRLEALVTTG